MLVRFPNEDFSFVFFLIFHERLHVLELLIYSNGITDCPFTYDKKNIMVQQQLNSWWIHKTAVNLFLKNLFRGKCVAFQIVQCQLVNSISVLFRFVITRLWTLFDIATQSRRSCYDVSNTHGILNNPCRGILSNK